MFAAGTDTTHTALEWTMTELLKHPEVMKKEQDEIRRITGSKISVTQDDVEKTLYLKAVIKESLR
jgi:cytochrome P450